MIQLTLGPFLRLLHLTAESYGSRGGFPKFCGSGLSRPLRRRADRRRIVPAEDKLSAGHVNTHAPEKSMSEYERTRWRIDQRRSLRTRYPAMLYGGVICHWQSCCASSRVSSVSASPCGASGGAKPQKRTARSLAIALPSLFGWSTMWLAGGFGERNVSSLTSFRVTPGRQYHHASVR